MTSTKPTDATAFFGMPFTLMSASSLTRPISRFHDGRYRSCYIEDCSRSHWTRQTSYTEPGSYDCFRKARPSLQGHRWLLQADGLGRRGYQLCVVDFIVWPCKIFILKRGQCGGAMGRMCWDTSLPRPWILHLRTPSNKCLVSKNQNNSVYGFLVCKRFLWVFEQMTETSCQETSPVEQLLEHLPLYSCIPLTSTSMTLRNTDRHAHHDDAAPAHDYLPTARVPLKEANANFLVWSMYTGRPSVPMGLLACTEDLCPAWLASVCTEVSSAFTILAAA